jgi:predicted permease
LRAPCLAVGGAAAHRAGAARFIAGARMGDVLNLALPYFGLIFLGLFCGKLKQIPEGGLAWMNFFLIYVSLPCLFYRVLALTPLEQLNNPRFIAATMLATAAMFALAFCIGWAVWRRMAEATMAGLSGAYGNIGYMGPGLALATLGSAANVPVALIFCFDTLLVFTLVPFLMTLSSPRRQGIAATALEVALRIALHPFIIATVLGVLSAALHFQPPLALDRLMQFLQNAAAPCALFTLGVTVALRPVQRIPWEVPGTIAVKLVVHPAAVLLLLLLLLLGPFDPVWVSTAVLMAALPPALNVFIMARQYDTWVAQASGSVLFGTFVSVLTLTSVMYLVKTGMLPATLFR